MRAPTIAVIALLASLASCRRTPEPSDLTETIQSADGALVAHYPKTFDARVKPVDNGSLIEIEPKAGTRGVGTLILMETLSIAKSVEEFAGRVGPAPDEQELARGPATCAGKAGLSQRARLLVDGFAFVRQRCFALLNGKGFMLTYVVPEDRLARGEPTMRRIMDALILN